MDLKYKKSPGEYEGTTTKSSRVQQHKVFFLNRIHFVYLIDIAHCL